MSPQYEIRSAKESFMVSILRDEDLNLFVSLFFFSFLFFFSILSAAFGESHFKRVESKKLVN